jgi:hypothetical protein
MALLYSKAPPIQMADQIVKPVDATPSLHPHYGDFNATTSCSAPLMCIDTFPIRGSHLLGFLLT